MDAPFTPLVFVFVGALFIALALPLIYRRIKPNGLYGVRVHATFADEAVWYEANAMSGRDLLLLGVLICLLAVSLPFVSGISPLFAIGLLLGVTLFGVIAMATIGISRANRLLRDREASTDS